MLSETVFLGDTAISLQTPAPTLVMGGGGSLHRPKSKVPQPGQVFIFGGGGTRVFWTNSNPFLSQIVSHTLRVWNLITNVKKFMLSFLLKNFGSISFDTPLPFMPRTHVFTWGPHLLCCTDFIT